MPGIDGGGTDDVVEHRVGIDGVVQKFPDAELVVGLEHEAPVVHPFGVRNQRLKGPDGHGLVEKVALHVAAAQAHQVRLLGFGLHALHDDGQRQRLGHVHDGFQYAHALPVAGVVQVQEVGVQLDDVDVQLVQHVQR